MIEQGKEMKMILLIVGDGIDRRFGTGINQFESVAYMMKSSWIIPSMTLLNNCHGSRKMRIDCLIEKEVS